MNNITVKNNEAMHVLYSTGYLCDEFEYFNSLEKLSEIMKRSKLQVQERILCCKTKKLKSSPDLEKLTKLKNKLNGIGLDVYIEMA